MSSTPRCPVCARWNDPTGGPEAHSSGCPQTGQPYPGYEPPPPYPGVEALSWDRYEVQPPWVQRAQSGTLPPKVYA